ncbi:MAG: STAS domain-containing protein [Oscillospiraceae bacterium]|jgi:anti-anti-sigma factor|nr:STAS domain-containing protein [Oscillospiraceae bacterium]
MEIIKVPGDDNLTLKIIGSIDSQAAPQFEAELTPMFDNSKNIILDFAEVAYISSAGMRVLLTGQKLAKAKNGKLSITGVTSFVMEIFDVTGFSKILDFI